MSDLRQLSTLIEQSLDEVCRSGLEALEHFVADHPSMAPAIRGALDRLKALGMLRLDEEQTRYPRSFGPFELRAPLGEGAMGSVFDARDAQGVCALKLIRPHLLHDPELRIRFQRERRALGRLRNPHVVRVLGSGEVDGTPYLACERLPGPSLAQWLRAPDLPESERRPFLLAAFESLARGLHEVHQQGILHRDLKPANLVLDAERRLVAVDFGLAAVDDSLRLTRTGSMLGTPAYSPLEQLCGEALDARSDVHALALSLAEAWSGTPTRALESGQLAAARRGDIDPRLRDRSLPPRLRRCLERATHPRRERRTADMASFAAELADAAARPEPALPRSLWGGLGLLALLAGLIAFATLRPDRGALEGAPARAAARHRPDPVLAAVRRSPATPTERSVVEAQLRASEEARRRGLGGAWEARIIDLVVHCVDDPSRAPRLDGVLEQRLHQSVARANSILAAQVESHVRLPDDRAVGGRAIETELALHVREIRRGPRRSDDDCATIAAAEADAVHVFLEDSADEGFEVGPRWRAEEPRAGSWGRARGPFARPPPATADEERHLRFHVAQQLLHLSLHAVGLPDPALDPLPDLPLHPASAPKHSPFNNVLVAPFTCMALTPTQLVLLDELLRGRARELLHRGAFEHPQACLSFVTAHDGMSFHGRERFDFTVSAKNSTGLDARRASLRARARGGDWRALEIPAGFFERDHPVGVMLRRAGFVGDRRLVEIELDHPDSAGGPVTRILEF